MGQAEVPRGGRRATWCSWSHDVPVRGRGSTQPSGRRAPSPGIRTHVSAVGDCGAASGTRCPGRRQTIAVRASLPVTARAQARAFIGHCSAFVDLGTAGPAPHRPSTALPRSRLPRLAGLGQRGGVLRRVTTPYRLAECGSGRSVRLMSGASLAPAALHSPVQAFQVFRLQTVDAVLAHTRNEVHSNRHLVAGIGVLADNRLGDVLDPALKPLLDGPRLSGCRADPSSCCFSSRRTSSTNSLRVGRVRWRRQGVPSSL